MNRSSEPSSARWTTNGVLDVVSAHVREPELLRHQRVELDRAHLPRAPEHVEHVEVDLRAVERTVALVQDVVDPLPLEGGAERGLREVPFLVRAEPVGRAGGEVEARLHPEEVVQVCGVVETGEDLRFDLLGGTEDVGVVLGYVADTEQAVERARGLVPVQGRRLGVAERQIAVAPELTAEEEHVPRAVHRLQPGVRLFSLAGDEEHLAPELLPVTRGLPHRLVVDERRLDLEIPAAQVLAPAHILEQVPDDHAPRVPERRAG